ncbi:MAG: hypothetical protein ACC707_04880 [Thiohalomonadales bacterium]
MLIKKAVFFLFALTLVACGGDYVLVRPLDSSIIDAAQRAKAAGANEITMELSVVSGYKPESDVPISVVTVGGEDVMNNTARVITKINNLDKWKAPKNFNNSNKDEYYILDIETFILEKPEVLDE